MKQDQEKEKKQSNTTQSVVNNPEGIKKVPVLEIKWNGGNSPMEKIGFYYEDKPIKN